jgi:hypothetical protein
MKLGGSRDNISYCKRAAELRPVLSLGLRRREREKRWKVNVKDPSKALC